MYICLCNALTDRHVKEAAAAGASRPAEIYEACRCRAQCGNCVKTVLGLLRDVTSTPDVAINGSVLAPQG